MKAPYSQACENNKQPILDVIRPWLTGVDRVLEVGSGTGQHAVHFARALPQLQWQPTDQPPYLDGIRAQIAAAGLDNVREPLALDVRDAWPSGQWPAIYSANTVHIMHWPQVVEFFEGVGQHLEAGGLFFLYGPFNYGDRYTSDSNARFDQWLKAQDPGSGIRDRDDIDQLAAMAGLELVEDYTMPANNRLLLWRKKS